jgi:hypothetical protein
MMKHPEFDQMVALAERLRLELDSSDRKNLVGSQIIPDKSLPYMWFSANFTCPGFRVNQDLGGAVACGLLLDGLVALPAEIEYSDDVNTDHEEHERKESRTISN